MEEIVTSEVLQEAEMVLKAKPTRWVAIEDHGPYYEKWGNCSGANQVIRLWMRIELGAADE